MLPNRMAQSLPCNIIASLIFPVDSRKIKLRLHLEFRPWHRRLLTAVGITAFSVGRALDNDPYFPPGRQKKSKAATISALKRHAPVRPARPSIHQKKSHPSSPECLDGRGFFGHFDRCFLIAGWRLFFCGYPSPEVTMPMQICEVLPPKSKFESSRAK
jgi:hypothetical protein